MAANVVVPQPLGVTESVPGKLKSGSVTVTTSPTLRSALSANRNDTEDGVEVVGAANTKLVSTMVGSTTAEDAMIDVALKSEVLASVTARVRVARFALCTEVPVVTPVATEITHKVSLAKPAFPNVNVNFGGEAVSETVKVEEPQLALTAGVASVPNVKSGSSIATMSFTIIGAFSMNANEIED